MNIESTKAFLDKLATDKDFANKFKAETTVDSLVSLMHSEGFECTNQEFNKMPGALTDDELEAVSGGVSDTSIPFLEAYCRNVPIGRVQVECFNVLEELRGSKE
jgi:predicted ribosomally synthesized peptide with nif11-like leader